MPAHLPASTCHALSRIVDGLQPRSLSPATKLIRESRGKLQITHGLDSGWELILVSAHCGFSSVPCLLSYSYGTAHLQAGAEKLSVFASRGAKDLGVNTKKKWKKGFLWPVWKETYEEALWRDGRRCMDRKRGRSQLAYSWPLAGCLSAETPVFCLFPTCWWVYPYPCRRAACQDPDIANPTPFGCLLGSNKKSWELSLFDQATNIMKTNV